MKAIKLAGILAIGVLIFFGCGIKEQVIMEWDVNEVQQEKPCAKLAEKINKILEEESLKIIRDFPSISAAHIKLRPDYKCITKGVMEVTIDQKIIVYLSKKDGSICAGMTVSATVIDEDNGPMVKNRRTIDKYTGKCK